MAKGIKICKVCGREYEACRTLRPNLNNEFRWQEVACSPEHGAEYLRRVLLARGMAGNEKHEAADAAPEKSDGVEAVAQAQPVKRTRKKKQADAAQPTV